MAKKTKPAGTPPEIPKPGKPDIEPETTPEPELPGIPEEEPEIEPDEEPDETQPIPKEIPAPSKEL